MKRIIIETKYNDKKLSKVVLKEIQNMNYNIFCQIIKKKRYKSKSKKNKQRYYSL